MSNKIKYIINNITSFEMINDTWGNCYVDHSLHKKDMALKLVKSVKILPWPLIDRQYYCMKAPNLTRSAKASLCFSFTCQQFHFWFPWTSVAPRILWDPDSTRLCLLVKPVIKFCIHGESPASTNMLRVQQRARSPMNFHQPRMCPLQHNVCMIENSAWSPPLQTALTQGDLSLPRAGTLHLLSASAAFTSL